MLSFAFAILVQVQPWMVVAEKCGIETPSYCAVMNEDNTCTIRVSISLERHVIEQKIEDLYAVCRELYHGRYE